MFLFKEWSNTTLHRYCQKIGDSGLFLSFTFNTFRGNTPIYFIAFQYFGESGPNGLGVPYESEGSLFNPHKALGWA